MPLPDAMTDVTVGAVVSICGPVWVRPEQRQVGGIAGAVRDGAALRLTAVTASAAVF